MKLRKPFSLIVSGVALALIGLSTPASADTVKVEMLDKGPEGAARVFRPALVHINPGDTVHFVATDFGHDVKSVDGLQPKGAKQFSGYKNAPLKVTLSQPGIHIYECASHRKKGMVGVVVVGDGPFDVKELKSDVRASDEVAHNGEERLSTLLQKLNTKQGT
jgi:pseudoazurin